MGSPTAHLPEPYREQEREILKQLVDATFDRFKQIVLDSRPELKADPASQEVVFTGRIFTAGEAKQQHLVDELGFVEDAVNRAVELAGLTAETARVVKYHKPVGLLDQLLVGQQDSSSRFDLARRRICRPAAWPRCSIWPRRVPITCARCCRPALRNE